MEIGHRYVHPNFLNGMKSDLPIVDRAFYCMSLIKLVFIVITLLSL